jgi:hypothetical protein
MKTRRFKMNMLQTSVIFFPSLAMLQTSIQSKELLWNALSQLKKKLKSGGTSKPNVYHTTKKGV